MSVFTFRNVKYLFCKKHNFVYAEGFVCPNCARIRRSIYDDWIPSVSLSDEPKSTPAPVSIVAAMAKLQPPTHGSFKIKRCEDHNFCYISGISQCPKCLFED